SYSTSVNLNVPPGTGYNALVVYRTTLAAPWTVSGLSLGTFDVTGGLASIAVTAPIGIGSYAAGAPLTVSWTPSPAVTSGVFEVWVGSNAAGWYWTATVAASGAPSYSTSVNLNVPPGTGYQALVVYRTTLAAQWTVGGFSPGTFGVN
ncbi:MAG TPA: hypothetical protein VIL51_11380, partial [Thermoleophilia bacterium]